MKLTTHFCNSPCAFMHIKGYSCKLAVLFSFAWQGNQFEDADRQATRHLAETHLHPLVVLLDEAGQLSVKGLHMPEVHLQGGRGSELLGLHRACRGALQTAY